MTAKPGQSKLRDLLVDDPVIIDDDYEFDEVERGYVDDQAITIQRHLVQSLLLGMHCTWLKLDGGSAAASIGDVVCSAGSLALTITRALASPMAAAGSALGVVILGGNQGDWILVALEGVIPASITGLVGSASGALYANVNTATARLVASGTPGSTLFGTVDPAGNLTLRPSPPAATGISASDLYVSIVDIAAGAGLAGLTSVAASRTQGVGFGAIQAGHSCVGARFYWKTTSTNVKVSLWDGLSPNSRLASVTVAVTGDGIYTATFASPVALQAGHPYAITMWDTAGAAYTAMNGTTSGTAPVGGFLPANGGNLSVVAGPFVIYCGATLLAGTSSASCVYGLNAAGDALPNAGADTTHWNPIEPMVA